MVASVSAGLGVDDVAPMSRFILMISETSQREGVPCS